MYWMEYGALFQKMERKLKELQRRLQARKYNTEDLSIKHQTGL